MFFLGSLISAAIKVTLFHASLEKRELIIVAPIAPTKANPDNSVNEIVLSSLITVLKATQGFSKFSLKTLDSKPIYSPIIIKANRANNFAAVKNNCTFFPLSIPFVFIYVKSKILRIATICLKVMVNQA